MKNVLSQTADVSQTMAQVALGQADAGFVYITDAKAANGKVSGLGGAAELLGLKPTTLASRIKSLGILPSR